MLSFGRLILFRVRLHRELALGALIGTGNGNGQLCRRAEAFEQSLLVVGLIKHFVVLREDIFLILLEHERQKF